MAETRSSSFSLSSSNTDWWNSSRGVPCRSRKGRADCSEGSRTPFSVCQHKRGNRCGQQVTAGAAKRNSNKKKGPKAHRAKHRRHPRPSHPKTKHRRHPRPSRAAVSMATRPTWNCSMAFSGSVQLVSVSLRSSPLATPSSCSPAYMAAGRPAGPAPAAVRPLPVPQRGAVRRSLRPSGTRSAKQTFRVAATSRLIPGRRG